MKKNKKGQAAIEYILTRIVPRQFEQGAKVILTVYELEK